jgi:sterol desaturase/sphingolipid hydroxylase (fatty acid hydroxylase superfamily)
MTLAFHPGDLDLLDALGTLAVLLIPVAAAVVFVVIVFKQMKGK